MSDPGDPLPLMAPAHAQFHLCPRGGAPSHHLLKTQALDLAQALGRGEGGSGTQSPEALFLSLRDPQVGAQAPPCPSGAPGR